MDRPKALFSYSLVLWALFAIYIGPVGPAWDSSDAPFDRGSSLCQAPAPGSC